nr:hypothetical protein [Tanacetum cinerariifolium]
MAVIKSNLGWNVKDFKGMTFEKIKAKFTTVWKQIKKFIPLGSKEEAERFKRKGIRFEQESVKKLKTSEGVPKEVKSPDEVSEEKKLYDTCEVHHVTAKDKEIFMLVEKDYPLRKGLAIGMISYKLQVENYSRMANELILKIYKIASTLRQKGRIVGNKMHKAFPRPVIEFPLVEEVPTASEESCHCQKKKEGIAMKIALLIKSRRNCQSKTITLNMCFITCSINLWVMVITSSKVCRFKAVTFPSILLGNPLMKTSMSFSEFGTMFGHKSANSWNLLIKLRTSFFKFDLKFIESPGCLRCILIEPFPGSYSRGGYNSSGTKKYRGSNSSDGGNTGDGVKITGGVI